MSSEDPDPFQSGGRQEAALEGTRNAVTDMMWIPHGFYKITKIVFTYNANQLIETLKAYQDATLMFTLTFTYNGDFKVTEIVRTEPEP
jgi:hypothetical protein